MPSSTCLQAKAEVREQEGWGRKGAGGDSQLSWGFDSGPLSWSRAAASASVVSHRERQARLTRCSRPAGLPAARSAARTQTPLQPNHEHMRSQSRVSTGCHKHALSLLRKHCHVHAPGVCTGLGQTLLCADLRDKGRWSVTPQLRRGLPKPSGTLLLGLLPPPHALFNLGS